MVIALLVLFVLMPRSGRAGEALRGAAEPAEPPPAPLTAGDAEPPDGTSIELLVERAGAQFRAGQYDEAARALRRAYARQPRPLYLFNAGQAYRKGGHIEEALAMYQEFIRVAPQLALAAEAQGYIQTLRTLAEQQRQNQEIRLQLSEEQIQAEAARQKAERQRILAAAVQEQLLLERKKNVPLHKRRAFQAVLGVTASLVVTGVVMGAALFHQLNGTQLGTLDATIKP